MDTHMFIRKLVVLFATIITLSFTQFAYALPGDILQTLTIKNNFNFVEIGGGVGVDDVGPTSPHGIAFYDGFMYVLDFGTDRIYKVYPQQVTDVDGTVHEAGDSDFNFPVSEPNGDGHLLDPGGNPLQTCGAHPVNTQYCGGGGLAFVNPYLWNASPITDQIIKIDIADGGVVTDNETINIEQFPSPTSLAYDGTFFWVLDWQSNTINKVNPTTGVVLASYDAGTSTITGTHAVGIVWDQKDLWISYADNKIIYRVKPNDASLSLDILDSFSAPGSSDQLSKPKDLAFDGEFLWHADSGTGKIYRLETDINPFGIVGCVEKNGIGINSGVLLSQTGAADKVSNTVDGCFQFSEFLPGVQVELTLNEAGVSGKPHITLNETEPGSTDVIIIVGTAYDEDQFGFTATDLEDDDATLTLAVTTTPNVTTAVPIGKNIDTSIPNPTGIIVAYNVIDDDGNNAETVYRTIYVLEVDTVKPDIILNGSSTMTIEQDISNANLYIEPGASATDNRDDNAEITNLIVIDGSVNTSVAGDYVITYNVTDEAGNDAVEATRTITVKDTTTATITLNGINPVSVEKGTLYTELFAQVVDDVDGTVTLDVSHTTGSVDTNTVGTYTINYSFTDIGGNTATTNRTVNVIDTEAPIISLRGDATVNHELNTTYTDSGASAADSTGEVISSNVPFTGSVNITVKGAYTLTYNISDASSNAAFPVTRVVNVDDTGAPSLTLLGNPTISLQTGDTYNETGATATDAVDDDATLTASIVISGDTVNTSINGQYQLVYNVTDSAGNAAVPVTRTVNVADTRTPVITLTGNQAINLQKGDTYTEQGATATDAVDDNATLTASIVISGDTVNTSINGQYQLIYNVNDSAGNAAVPVTRTVTVSDTGAPIITLNGNNVMTVEQGSTFTDPGASATDTVDDNAILTNNIGVTGTVNTATLGNYTLSYNVSDSSGNAAITVTRTVQVVTAADTIPPVITLNGNSSITIEQFTTYTDLGATATDNIDNNSTVTANIQTSGIVNTGAIGNYTVSYNVSDAAGNAATALQRTVQVTVAPDTTPPFITLIGNNTLSVVQNSSFTDPGVNATDNMDNNATTTANVVATSNVNTTTLGSYSISYNVSDLAGNAATTVSRTVNVIATADTTPPVITLIGSNNIILEQNTTYTEPGANATDNVDNNTAITNNILYSGSVNTAVIANYTLSYDVFDAAGNAAPTVTRIIQVIAPADTTPPMITLQGSNPVNLFIGDTYNDPGYSATDNIDGIITGSVLLNSSAINTNAVGSYSVTYNVSDNAGNAAIMVTRTVNVSTAPDTTPPTISLLGNNPFESTIGIIYNDPGVSATDNVDGNISANVVLDSSAVNINAIGSYSVTYNVSDQAGNPAATVTRSVNIIAAPDVTPPIIAIEGDNPYEVIINTTYTDPGVSAIDNLDGAISENVSINSSAVNMSSLGSYTVTYNVSDAAGNAATQKTRTVNVASVNKTYSASPALAVGAASVSTTINITDDRQISDLNITIDMPHAYVGDISVILSSPSGTSVTIIDRPGYTGSGWGCDQPNFLMTLDDEGSSAAEGECSISSPAVGGTLTPNNALSTFDGESSQGTWTLQVDDAYTSGDTGTLNSWSLDVTQ